MRKLWSTVKILTCMFLARMFGEYKHSLGGPNQPDVAVYYWRDSFWWIPTSSYDYLPQVN